jgi:hypothetical protein
MQRSADAADVLSRVFFPLVHPQRGMRELQVYRKRGGTGSRTIESRQGNRPCSTFLPGQACFSPPLDPPTRPRLFSANLAESEGTSLLPLSSGPNTPFVPLPSCPWHIEAITYVQALMLLSRNRCGDAPCSPRYMVATCIPGHPNLGKDNAPGQSPICSIHTP